MSLLNWEINLILTWSGLTDEGTYAETDAKIYVQVVTLSTNDNAKL